MPAGSPECTPSGTLHIYDMTCCEAAHLLFCLQVIPAGMLRVPCLHGHASELTSLLYTHSEGCTRVLDDGDCGAPMLALMHALRVHAGSLEHLSLSRVPLSYKGVTQLGNALKQPPLQLRTLCMHDVRVPNGRAHVSHLLAGCTALTSQRIQEDGHWSHHLDVSALPHLRHLAVAGQHVL
eukprot:jgi/Ulvmu1/976/UM103_0003.1